MGASRAWRSSGVWEEGVEAFYIRAEESRTAMEGQSRAQHCRDGLCWAGLSWAGRREYWTRVGMGGIGNAGQDIKMICK